MALLSKPKSGLSTVRLPGGIHFAWAIVVILALVQIIGNSIGMAVGVVVIPLSDPEGDFGWSMVTIGAALMVYYLVGAVVAPMTGWLGDRVRGTHDAAGGQHTVWRQHDFCGDD